MLLTALVFAIASPAAAQTAAPAEQHQGHAQDHHQKGDEHSGHKMDGKCCEEIAGGKTMDCCEKMKKEGKKMPCCDHHESKSEAGAHEGHGKH